MGRKLAGCFLACILVGSVAWGNPVPISGTFHKGASFGGEHQLVGPVLQIRDELGLGSVAGGILTGSAEYTLREEIVNLAGGVGTLRAEVKISKPNGSVIVLGLAGFTSGISVGVQSVTVQGSWWVVSATGPDAGLHGEGQFIGDENFITGETDGSFTGQVVTSQ